MCLHENITMQYVLFHFFSSYFNFHGLAELICKGYAVEVMAVGAFVNGHDVKQYKKEGQEARCYEEAKYDAYEFSPTIVLAKVDMWEEYESEQETKDEAHQVGIVVHHGQEANDKQDHEYCRQLDNGPPWVLQDVPVVDHLHKHTGQDAKLGPCWSCL